MTNNDSDWAPSASQLMTVIATQTEIAKLGLDLNGVMTLVAERAQTLTRASGAVVEMAEGDEMVYRAVAGAASKSLGLRLKKNASLSGACVQSAATLRCDDSDTDGRVDRGACRSVGLRSMVVVPLIHLGEAVGALKVFAPTPSAFSERDSRVLSLMSDLIAAAMFHAVKYEANEIFRRATRDNLTGLANRALFYDRLRHGLEKARRLGSKLAVLMIDMDGLKPINDVFGHRAGDAAIKEIAARIAAEVRQSDTAARLGGDEFAIVLSSVGNRDSVLAAVRRIAARCDQLFGFEGQTLKIGASIGLSIYPDDGQQPDDLIEKADHSMYVVKREKRSLATR
jgi:diguanylate cyclase (GGDEF)-like protein